MAHSIISLYLIRDQVPFFFKNTRAFRLIFFDSLSKFICKKSDSLKTDYLGYKVVLSTQKYDRARVLLIQTKIVPAKLIIAKMSLTKFR